MSWFGGGDDGEGALLLKVLANQQRIEAKLDKLLAAFDLHDAPEPAGAGPLGLAPAQRDEIAALMASDRKIDAIKRLRELSGLGLADAKQAVETGRF